jgi:hypothetical protein
MATENPAPSKDQIITRLLNLQDPTDNDRNEIAQLIKIRMQTGAQAISAAEADLLKKESLRKLIKSLMYPIIAAAQTILVILLVRA